MEDVVYSENDVGSCVESIGVGEWVASLVQASVNSAQFNKRDFLGGDSIIPTKKTESIIPIATMVPAMSYFAFKCGISGRDTEWDGDCYRHFREGSETFEKALKRVESCTTKGGRRKIAQIRREIRQGVEEREQRQRDLAGNGDGAGAGTPGEFVFAGVPEMESLFRLDDPLEFIERLQSLGDHPQHDPRYYVHMVCRYFLSDLHQCLAARDEVMRYPTLQKVLDAKHGVSSRSNLPPEFRSFMKRTGGKYAPVVASLPVPSKTVPNEVVYGFDFESVPWVWALRKKIYESFSGWKDPSSRAFADIYPECLLSGSGNNGAVLKAVAKSYEMDGVRDCIASVEDAELAQKLQDAVAAHPKVAAVYTRYCSSNMFGGSGDQLAARQGFFNMSANRAAFQGLIKAKSLSCEDIYGALTMRFDTIDSFLDYCTAGRRPLSYDKRDEDVRRAFVGDMERICYTLECFSKKAEAGLFFAEHESTDEYLCGVLSGFTSSGVDGGSRHRKKRARVW